MPSVREVLEKLRVKSGLTGMSLSLDDAWRIGLGYSREEEAFVCHLSFKHQTKTVRLLKTDIETRGKSQWMTNNTWRLTESGISRLTTEIEKAIAATNAKHSRRAPDASQATGRMTPEVADAIAGMNRRFDKKLKEIVADDFLSAMSSVPRAPRFRKWTSPDEEIVRLYYGGSDAYFTVHHDGVADKSRGEVTFYSGLLHRGERVAFNQAMKSFREAMVALADWQIGKRARETETILARMG